MNKHVNAFVIDIQNFFAIVISPSLSISSPIPSDPLGEVEVVLFGDERRESFLIRLLFQVV